MNTAATYSGSERWRHALVVTCPCCSQRRRVSGIAAGWLRYPEPTFSDAEWMIVRSRGRGRIEHVRMPLWDALDAADATDAASLRERVGTFLVAVTDRLRAGVVATQIAAARARGM